MENKQVEQIIRIVREQDLIGLANFILSYHIPGPGMTETKQKFRNKVLESKFLPTLLNLLTNTYLANGKISCLAVDVYVDNFIKIFIDGESKNSDNKAIMKSWDDIVDKPVLGQPVENFAELHKWRLGQTNNAPMFEPPKPQPNDFMCDNCESKGDCDGDNEEVKSVGIIHHIPTDKTTFKPKLKIKDGVVIKAWYKPLPNNIITIALKDQMEKNFHNLMNTTNIYKLVAKRSHLSEIVEMVTDVISSNEFDKQRFHENFEMFMNKLQSKTRFDFHNSITLELNVVSKPKQKRYLKK